MPRLLEPYITHNIYYVLHTKYTYIPMIFNGKQVKKQFKFLEKFQAFKLKRLKAFYFFFSSNLNSLNEIKPKLYGKHNKTKCTKHWSNLIPRKSFLGLIWLCMVQQQQFCCWMLFKWVFAYTNLRMLKIFVNVMINLSGQNEENCSLLKPFNEFEMKI